MTQPSWRWTRFLFVSGIRVYLTMIAVSVLAWLLLSLSPGSAAERAARAKGVLPADDSALGSQLRADLISRVGHIHGLDTGVRRQLETVAKGAARFDFGRSWRTGASVRRLVFDVSLKTFALIALGLVSALLVGLGLASLSLGFGTFSMLGAGAIALLLITPPVWLALLGMRIGGGETHWSIAIACVATIPTAIIARHARAHWQQSSVANWARALRARGVDERAIRWRYSLRLAVPSLSALFPGLIGYSLGAAMVIETVFGIRGLGATLAESSQVGDAPVVVAVLAIGAIAISVASVVAKGLAIYSDPRLEVNL